MKSTFSVYFYLKKGDLLTGGYAPIMGRITIDGVSKQFATQLKIILTLTFGLGLTVFPFFGQRVFLLLRQFGTAFEKIFRPLV